MGFCDVYLIAGCKANNIDQKWIHEKSVTIQMFGYELHNVALHKHNISILTIIKYDYLNFETLI